MSSWRPLPAPFVRGAIPSAGAPWVKSARRPKPHSAPGARHLVDDLARRKPCRQQGRPHRPPLYAKPPRNFNEWQIRVGSPQAHDLRLRSRIHRHGYAAVGVGRGTSHRDDPQPALPHLRGLPGRRGQKSRSQRIVMPPIFRGQVLRASAVGGSPLRYCRAYTREEYSTR